ncbi:conjugative transposon protein TraN [Flavobacterium lindanitolerans]|uniref:conjugative transposon protein TraN n=1 Tax=Flavobacterium lindanitolerans TaxID=428988 RepID=UPI0023F3022E|nr:conjugative transposon protein TraN [Flavobacterium lindanitolerans]
MKTLIMNLWAIILLLVPITIHAQQKTLGAIEPYRVQISTDKTTNIIFPLAIVSVDRGSRHILVQKAKGVENILQVKAANDSIKESNLSVITADGKLSSFIVNYAKEPMTLNVSLENDPRKGTIFLSSDQINQAEIGKYSEQALHSRKRIGGIHQKNFGISFRLSGIFIHDGLMYFRVRIENQSNIGYDIDQLRFYIQDQKKAKRTASQEVEITPVSIYRNTTKIAPLDAVTLVITLPKFTIPDKKYLAVQLMEANGGRHAELEVKNREVMRAAPLK